MKYLILISSILISVIGGQTQRQNKEWRKNDKPHHHEMRRSKHFWHSVCGPRSLAPQASSEELMSEVITLNCIRTYGMSQSDRNNNIVNNYRLGNIDKEKEKQQQQIQKKQQQQLRIRKRRYRSTEQLLDVGDNWVENLPSLRPNKTSVSSVKILSSSNKEVQIGGELELQCVAHEEPPFKIWWWLNGTRLDVLKYEDGLKISNIRQRDNSKSATSQLRKPDIKYDDAGQYECRVEKSDHYNQHPAMDSVSVTVIDPINKPYFSMENVEQFESDPSGAPPPNSVNVLCMILLVIYVFA